MRNGCKHHDNCFTCPFTPDCIEGLGLITNKGNVEELRGIVRQKREAGVTPLTIAREHGISKMTVYRYCNG